MCVGIHVRISILTSEAKYEKSPKLFDLKKTQKRTATDMTGPQLPRSDSETLFEFNLDWTVRGALPENLTLYS